jgi:excisionase family DNA binding protein
MDHITFEQLPTAVSGLFAKLESIEKLLLNQQTVAPDELLTVEQAAEFLKLSVPTIYSKVQYKQVPVNKQAGRLYFSKAELIEYVKAGRKKTQAELKVEAANYVAKRKGGNRV